MNLLVIGATGRTGQQVVKQALSRGHSVTALVRTRSLSQSERLTLVTGDPRRSQDVLSTLSGHDAVISCLGQNSPHTPELVAQSAAVTIQAMWQLNIQRLAIVSGGLLFPSINPLVIAMKLLLATKLKDAKAMEHAVCSSGLEWIIARPPHLVGGEQTVGYQTSIRNMPSNRWSMQFAGLAAFLLDAVEDRQFVRHVVGIGPA